MAAGLQCFDASGVLTFNSADFLGRFLGSFAAGTTDGTFTATGATALGTLFYIWLADAGTAGYYGPGITNSGDVISWAYGSLPAGYRMSGTVFYGVK